jgi:hypothetical protein
MSALAEVAAHRSQTTGAPIEITGMLRVEKPARENGTKILAFFDANISDAIILRGCSLVRTKKNGLTTWPARGRLDEQNSVRHSVSIIDSNLLHRLTEAARATYRMLGGVDAEWEPRE